MLTNNFNTSTMDEDIEIHIFRDSDLSRMDFEDNFDRIDSSYRSDNLFWFTACGEFPKLPDVSDCVDWDKVSQRDARYWLFDRMCKGSFPTPFRDLVDECRECFDGDWVDMLKDWLDGGCPSYDSIDLVQLIRDDFDALGELPIRLAIASASGYCQGDYALILYDPSGWGESVDFHQMFSRYLYDSPIYAKAVVDGKEYYIDDSMDDNYDWDLKEVTAIVRSWGLDDETHDWIIDQLPEYPEYC